ncbi:MAG TPA: TonB-dependent receptor [Arenimonas sp.]|nr:TonB-dependent receptor [Arenimonas sp.]
MRRALTAAALSVICLSSSLATAHSASEVDFLDLSLEQLLMVDISVSSRSSVSLLNAPSVVSVFTAADFRRMGARDLRDVLRRVPGFELGIRSFGYAEFGMRGVITDNSEKVLILLDGLPVNEHLEGSGTIVFADLPLDNIERIEVMRGPGSALYGTNAFVGVISLISRSPGRESLSVTARGGSFGHAEGSVRASGSRGGFRYSGFLHALRSDGDGPRIPVDALQIRNDPPWFAPINAPISLAGSDRGRVDWHRDTWIAQAQMAMGNWSFQALALDARKGPYIGTVFAINENSQAHPQQIQAELAYSWQLTERWTLQPRLHWRRYIADNLWNSFPEGYRIPDSGGGDITYIHGQFDRQGATQQTRGIELKSTAAPRPGHTLVAGVAYEDQLLYDVVNQTNVPGYGPERMVDAGPILLGEPRRSLFTAYVQHQWQALPQLGITSGLRLDRYNDAGTSLTPRFAAVWNASEQLTLKALYGEGFRAPTFAESYLFAYGGFARGNAANTPETIRTSELVAIYRLGQRLLWQGNVYRSRISDLLQLVPTDAGYLEYRNQVDTTVIDGLESELTLHLGERSNAYLNISHERSRNEATGQPLLGMARWRANAGLDFAFSERLNTSINARWLGRRSRAPGDARAPLSSEFALDLALGYAVSPRLDLTFAAHNLLDAEVRFPDISSNIPGDFPMEGRALSVSLVWQH